MPKGKRQASRNAARKAPVYNASRIRPGVDYSRLTPAEIRRIHQDRGDKWRKGIPKPPLSTPPPPPLAKQSGGSSAEPARASPPVIEQYCSTSQHESKDR